MTYSILAKKGEQFAIGTITASVAVGGFVPHIHKKYGCIATQGFYTNGLYKDWAFEALSQSIPPKQVIDMLLQKDKNHIYRQCILMDKAGQTAGYSGSQNDDYKGHICQNNLAVAGNRLAGPAVLEKMVEAYESSVNKDLFLAILEALKASYEAGGDKKGAISGVIKIISPSAPPLDLRVDYAPEQVISQLKQLYNYYQQDDFQDFINKIPTDHHPDKAG